MPTTPKRAGRTPRPGSRFLADAVADNVRAHRVLAKLSQGDVAERMRGLGHDWTQTTVSDIERGERNVTVDELVGLALVFQISPQDLIDPRGVDGRGATPVDIGPGDVRTKDIGDWLQGRGFTFMNWSGNTPQVLQVLAFGEDAEGDELTEKDLT